MCHITTILPYDRWLHFTFKSTNLKTLLHYWPTSEVTHTNKHVYIPWSTKNCMLKPMSKSSHAPHIPWNTPTYNTGALIGSGGVSVVYQYIAPPIL